MIIIFLWFLFAFFLTTLLHSVTKGSPRLGYPSKSVLYTLSSKIGTQGMTISKHGPAGQSWMSDCELAAHVFVPSPEGWIKRPPGCAPREGPQPGRQMVFITFWDLARLFFYLLCVLRAFFFYCLTYWLKNTNVCCNYQFWNYQMCRVYSMTLTLDTFIRAQLQCRLPWFCAVYHNHTLFPWPSHAGLIKLSLSYQISFRWFF